MVGVSDPLYKRRKADGICFLCGLAFGQLVACCVVVALLLPISMGVNAIFPPIALSSTLALVLLTLGTLDLSNRTPYKHRQVPQRFALGLADGPRGVIWGIDLGLLVTTQKTTSLWWAALVGSALTSSEQVPAVLFGGTAVCVTGIAWFTVNQRYRGEAFTSVISAVPSGRLLRCVSGSALVVVAAVTAARVFVRS